MTAEQSLGHAVARLSGAELAEGLCVVRTGVQISGMTTKRNHMQAEAESVTNSNQK